MSLRLAFLAASVFCFCAGSLRAQGEKIAKPVDSFVVKIDPASLPVHSRVRLGQLGGFRYNGPASFSAAMSLDGKLIAAADQNGGIKIIDAASGKALQNLAGQFIGNQGGLVFSDDGSTLAVESFQDVRVWDVATGKMRQQVQNRNNFGRVYPPSLSRDGKMIAIASAQIAKGNNNAGQVRAVDVATGKVIGPFDALHNYNIRAVIAPDGKTMISFGQYLNRAGAGGFDRDAPRTLQLWDLAAGKELRKVTLDLGVQGLGQISNAAYAPDGKTLAVTSGGSTFHLIEADTGKEIRRFAGLRGTGFGASLRFSPDGAILAAYGYAAPQAWHVKTGKRLELDDGPKAMLHAIAFPGKDRIIALGTIGQALHWWDANLAARATPFAGHLDVIDAVAFTSDGRSVVSAGADQTLIWWDAGTGKETRRLSLPQDEFGGRFGAGRGRGVLALSADARYAATGDQFGGVGIRLWNLKTARPVLDFDLSRAAFQVAAAFAPDGSKLAAADGPTPHLWDISTGQELLKLPANNARNAVQPAHLALSPDGKLIAVHASQFDMLGRQNADLIVWDIAQAKELHRSNRAVPNDRGGTGSASPLAFSPDGQLLAVAEVNGSITVLRARTGKEAVRFTSAQRNSAVQLAFSPDLRFLAVGHFPYGGGGGLPGLIGFGNGKSDEPSIEIWELAGGEVRERFVGHTGGITGLAYSPDGATLASASADTTLLLWDCTGKHGPKFEPLPAADIAAAWQALADKKAKIADTLGRLACTPGTLDYLKQNFQPAKRGDVDEKQLAKLVADLDAGNFKSREAATRELKQRGEQARAALQKGLASAASIEATRRMQELLDLLERTELTPQELQAIRGVEVLERIGNAEARDLLAALAKGDPAARVTQEAAAACKRLEPH